MERAEDAGVYKLTPDLALVQTVDFFTPIVDDPYDFGRIAVANSLSDVYAMGGKPVTALNVVCFPSGAMDLAVLHEVLEGGLNAMHEAGVVLLGGHTVDDPELKYGLAVTGTVRPDDVVHSNTARPGDALILTKPLGTGVISTAIKAGVAAPQAVARITASMTALNRAASELMQEVGVHACKDVTGFGLLGHAAEMIVGADVGFEIDSAAVPVFPEALEYAGKGMVPGGTGRNRDYVAHLLDMGSGVSSVMQDILHDPQTSGGLLIAVPQSKAHALLSRLHQKGVKEAAIIGKVTAANNGRIKVM
jgi:selenide,water dikinase